MIRLKLSIVIYAIVATIPIKSPTLEDVNNNVVRNIFYNNNSKLPSPDQYPTTLTIEELFQRNARHLISVMNVTGDERCGCIFENTRNYNCRKSAILHLISLLKDEDKADIEHARQLIRSAEEAEDEDSLRVRFEEFITFVNTKFNIPLAGLMCLMPEPKLPPAMFVEYMDKALNDEFTELIRALKSSSNTVNYSLLYSIRLMENEEKLNEFIDALKIFASNNPSDAAFFLHKIVSHKYTPDKAKEILSKLEICVKEISPRTEEAHPDPEEKNSESEKSSREEKIDNISENIVLDVQDMLSETQVDEVKQEIGILKHNLQEVIDENKQLKERIIFLNRGIEHSDKKIAEQKNKISEQNEHIDALIRKATSQERKLRILQGQFWQATRYGLRQFKKNRKLVKMLKLNNIPGNKVRSIIKEELPEHDGVQRRTLTI